jgi:hypothetical protein
MAPTGPMGFPWEREWESELDGKRNGNDATVMGGNGNRTVNFPLKGKKKLITYCSVIQCFS